MFEPSSGITSETAKTLGVPKGQGSWGVGKDLVDQQALPLNPVDSTALKTQSMTIRNEVTARLFSAPKETEQVLTGYSELERLIQKRMPACNGKDMQTESR